MGREAPIGRAITGSVTSNNKNCLHINILQIDQEYGNESFMSLSMLVAPLLGREVQFDIDLSYVG